MGIKWEGDGTFGKKGKGEKKGKGCLFLNGGLVTPLCSIIVFLLNFLIVAVWRLVD